MVRTPAKESFRKGFFGDGTGLTAQDKEVK
jgi:hypothetical protein